MGVVALDIGANSSVQKGFRMGARRVEEGVMEEVVAVHGDEGEEEGLGVDELVVAEEGGEEREK